MLAPEAFSSVSTTGGYAYDDDRGNALELAVKDWIQRGEQIPLKDVPYSIFETICCYFPAHLETWKTLGSALYANLTHFDIDRIEGDARVHLKHPSQILLLYCCNDLDLSFSALMTILYRKLKRLDCLQTLYDEKLVTEFLECRERQSKLTQPRTTMKDALYELTGHSNKYALKSDTDNFKFHKKYENRLDLVGRLEEPTFREILQVVNSCKVSNNNRIVKNNGDDPVSQQKLSPNKSESDAKSQSPILKPHQCIYSSKRVVVLLTYSADANTDIPQLVQKFWDASIGVVAEWVLRGKGYFEASPRDAWEAFFKQCNFVVPVISPQYLRDIQHPSDSDQAPWVRFVYDLYTTKYVRDGCLNKVVRPLVMDNVQEKALQKVNPALSMRWRLQEMDDFIDMLKKNVRYPN